jgi:hypothetical protein
MAKCIKELLDGKTCDRETIPRSNYCEEHDPAEKHQSAGGGGGGFLNSDRKGSGVKYGPSK